MMKEMKTGILSYNNESYDFNFKTSLSAHDKQMFVRTVVDNLVGDNGYDVIIKDLIFDFAIIDIFTNIDTSFINMKDEDGDDIDPIILVEHFLEETDVVDIIKANMEDGLLDDLSNAVDLNIQYLTGISPNPLNAAVARLVSTIEKKINEVDLGSLTDAAQKLSSIGGDFTLENIVNAYMKSGVHKENLAEIQEAKK